MPQLLLLSQVSEHTEFLLSICPQKGLHTQNYRCAECRIRIGFRTLTHFASSLSHVQSHVVMMEITGGVSTDIDSLIAICRYLQFLQIRTGYRYLLEFLHGSR